MNLKEKVFEAKGLEVDSQKIVFKGKATNNPDVLSNIGVKDNDFLVVMNLIKKPEKKEEPKKEETGKVEEKPAENPVSPVKPPVVEPLKQEGANESEADITELMSMGFER